MKRNEPRATVIGRWVGRIVLTALLVALGIPMVRLAMRQSGISTDLQPYTPERYAETRRRGEELIAALGTWKAREGRYPERLADLLPSDVSEFKPPLVGDGVWNYRRPSPEQFVLNFFVGPIYECDLYDSAKRDWYTDR